MNITEKQLLMLLKVAENSLNIVNLEGFDQETRRKLISDIYNQQSDEKIEINNLNNPQ